MSEFVPWNSQPLETWAEQHAAGQFIELEGKQTHYVQRGEGEPLILIHGFNMDWYTWMENIDALAEHFQVYAIDLWGAGLSTRERLDYGYDLFVQQIKLFLEAMGIEKASLVGHSMGGGTSIVFTCHYRPLVDKLVLVDSAAMPHKQPFRAQLFQTRGLAELALGLNTNFFRRRNLLDFWVHNKELLTDDKYATMISYQKIRGTTEINLEILRKNFFHTLANEVQTLAGLDVPTLLVWGQEDNVVPTHLGRQIHDALNCSRLEIVENVGHMPNFENPERFNRLVIEFLSEQRLAVG